MTETVVLPAATATTTDRTLPPEQPAVSPEARFFPRSMNERIVCLDIGDGTIASPVEVIQRVGWGPDTRRIVSICERYETNRILSGLPLNMDGSEGFQAQKVRQFCDQLVKAGLQVVFQDERLSTVSAEDALIEGGVSRAGRKQKVDMIAASVILRQWLEENKNKEG